MRKNISKSRNKFEDLIQMVKNSEQGMNFLYSSLSNLVEVEVRVRRNASVGNVSK